jgi:hypothetical protein
MEYIQKQAKQLIESTADDHFVALNKKKTTIISTVEMSDWENHFESILHQDTNNTVNHVQRKHYLDFPRISDEEVIETIRSTRDRKGAGPDGIFNEHLKATLPYHASTCPSYLIHVWR